MDALIPLFAVVVVLTAALAGIAIWAPRSLRLKLTALGTIALLLPVTYLSLTELLGRPKPVDLEWSHTVFTDANVLAMDLREDEAIYLWLQADGTSAPRAYVLPWDLNVARQLYAAQQSAQTQGTPLRMRRMDPNQSDDDVEPMFYAAPQPRPPSKS